MAIEKSWPSVGPLLLQADGTTDGIIRVLSTKKLHVKQQILIVSPATSESQKLEIKAIISKEFLRVGPIGSSNMEAYSDVSNYLASDSCFIRADKQPRSSIPEKEYERAVFAEEPIVAKRAILVDELGEYFSKDNPLPVEVDLVVDSVEVNVDLDAFDEDPDSVLAVGSEDGTEGGTKHAFKVGSDKNLRVKDEDAITAIGDVKDAVDTVNQTILDATQELVTAVEAVNSSVDQTTQAVAEVEQALGTVNQSVQEGNLLLDSLDTKATIANQTLESIDQGIDLANQSLQDIEQHLSDIESSVSKSIKTKILESDDRLRTVNYADFGNINQRITSLVFTSSSVPGYILTRTFNFVLDQGRYKRTTDQWSLQTV